jgi:hypothetical protein
MRMLRLRLSKRWSPRHDLELAQLLPSDVTKAHASIG